VKKKGSGTVAGSARTVLRTTVPGPFSYSGSERRAGWVVRRGRSLNVPVSSSNPGIVMHAIHVGLQIHLIAIALLAFQGMPTPIQERVGDGKSIKAPTSRPEYKKTVELSQAKGVMVTGSLQAGLFDAAKDGKMVFLAFLGATDPNSLLDLETFANPAAKEAMKSFILIVLFADVVPDEFFDKKLSSEQRSEEGIANQNFQTVNLSTRQIPLHVILTPVDDGRFSVVSQYEKAIGDQLESFVAFLGKANAKKRTK
jgi:hypothetical protein